MIPAPDIISSRSVLCISALKVFFKRNRVMKRSFLEFILPFLGTLPELFYLLYIESKNYFDSGIFLDEFGFIFCKANIHSFSYS